MHLRPFPRPAAPATDDQGRSYDPRVFVVQRLGAVAVAAPNSLKHERTVELAFADGIALPLLVLWRAGVPSSAVDRVRAAMSNGVDEPQ